MSFVELTLIRWAKFPRLFGNCIAKNSRIDFLEPAQLVHAQYLLRDYAISFSRDQGEENRKDNVDG
jgi:hypothetical protein